MQHITDSDYPEPNDNCEAGGMAANIDTSIDDEDYPPVVDERTMLERVLDYDAKVWHEDCAEYVLSDDENANRELRILLKEAVSWHKTFADGNSGTYDDIINQGYILGNVAEKIGRLIIYNLYANTGESK